MLTDPQPARLRAIAYRLWRLSLDRGKDISFEDRRRLAILADGIEDAAGQLVDQVEGYSDGLMK